MSTEDTELKCHCETCESHRFIVKDRHPEMKWRDPKWYKMKEKHDLERVYGKKGAEKIIENR